jgi:hypothetical protein
MNRFREYVRNSGQTGWAVAGKALMGAMAMQGSALTELEWGYVVDIPVVKYFFAIFRNVNGWGMEVIFLAVAMACMFYLVRKHPLQRSPWIRGISLFFGICMVFGRSYQELGNWNYIFHGKLQFGLACFVIAGYYWAFQNGMILLKAAVDKWELSSEAPRRRVEKWLFEKHPFLGPFTVIAALELPFLINFFPGTLQWDAHAQFWTYIGALQPWTAHHPVASTWLLGQCLHVSRTVFGNDSMALFLYAGPQFVVQWFVFAYEVYMLNRMKTPVFLRWSALLYLTLFPLLQIWGFTVSKDSCYYVYLVLLATVVMHILYEKKVVLWQWILIPICSGVVTGMRNNGIYVLILFCIIALAAYFRYWKVYVLILVSALGVLSMEKIYMAQKDIPSGPIREMFSIPLQQTARYVKEHYEDITEEEMEVLSHMFRVEVAELSALYNPDISDPIKEEFLRNPTAQELSDYFRVWFGQFWKHPDTYIQAFLHHTYGYFYPNREAYFEGIGYYYIGNEQHWQDGYLDMEFAVKYQELRDMYEQGGYYWKRAPVVGMLYSCGFQNYILIGCMVYLLAHKKYRELAALAPALLTMLVCLASPVDAYLRYMLPVVAAMPLNVGWCHACGRHSGDEAS